MTSYSGNGFLRNLFAYGCVCGIYTRVCYWREHVSHLDVFVPYARRRSEGLFLVIPSNTGDRSKCPDGFELLFKLNRHVRERIQLDSLRERTRCHLFLIDWMVFALPPDSFSLSTRARAHAVQVTLLGKLPFAFSSVNV